MYFRKSIRLDDGNKKWVISEIGKVLIYRIFAYSVFIFANYGVSSVIWYPSQRKNQNSAQWLKMKGGLYSAMDFSVLAGYDDDMDVIL